MSKIVLRNHPDDDSSPLLPRVLVPSLTAAYMSWVVSRRVDQETGDIHIAMALDLDAGLWPVYITVPREYATEALELAMIERRTRKVRLVGSAEGIVITSIQLTEDTWAGKP